jgi:hypothetical protein
MTLVLISVHSAEGFVVLCVVVFLEIERVLTGFLIGLNNLFQPIKKPVRTLSIFTSMAFVKDANGISFKNRLKGHINWRKVRNFIII